MYEKTGVNISVDFNEKCVFSFIIGNLLRFIILSGHDLVIFTANYTKMCNQFIEIAIPVAVSLTFSTDSYNAFKQSFKHYILLKSKQFFL